jgi:hypothetical protein
LEDDHGIRGECYESVREVPENARRKPSLCFIGFARGQISHVARAEIRFKARSGNDRLDLWKMEALPRPMGLGQDLRAGPTTNARARATKVD